MTAFDRIGADGSRERIERVLADETPVAIEFNGIGYAVLMASAVQVDDLVRGFALSERLIETAAEISAVDLFESERGIVARATLAPSRVDTVLDRVRHRVSESSCGICGIENLDQALRPLPLAAPPSEAGDSALFAALAALDTHQQGNRQTGAMHAAAACAMDGSIRLVREDVGRHNAFDKLVGAMLATGMAWDGGFALLTSRCSYELVEKAALAKCPMLVTISAPTTLAVRRAREVGLRLVALARRDSVLELSAAD